MTCLIIIIFISTIAAKLGDFFICRVIGRFTRKTKTDLDDKLIAMMDSDDLMVSSWLKHSLEIMKKGNYSLCGTNQMIFLYPKDNWKTTPIQCVDKRMMHEAGMLFTKKHWKAMGGFISSSQGEGTKMVDNMNEKKVGLTETSKVIVCICHTNNTINKDRFKEYKEVGVGEQLSDYHRQLILRCIE